MCIVNTEYSVRYSILQGIPASYQSPKTWKLDLIVLINPLTQSLLMWVWIFSHLRPGTLEPFLNIDLDTNMVNKSKKHNLIITIMWLHSFYNRINRFSDVYFLSFCWTILALNCQKHLFNFTVVLLLRNLLTFIFFTSGSGRRWPFRSKHVHLFWDLPSPLFGRLIFKLIRPHDTKRGHICWAGVRLKDREMGKKSQWGSLK